MSGQKIIEGLKQAVAHARGDNTVPVRKTIVSSILNVSSIYQHDKRGSFYIKLMEAELQSKEPIVEGTSLVIYVDADGKVWARPASEFNDGRFTPKEDHDCTNAGSCEDQEWL